MRRTRSLALVGLGTLALFGCADAGPGPAPAAERNPIVNSEVSGPEDDATVSVNVRDAFACTGSLIAPNAVLTALHCLTHFDYQTTDFRCNADGTLDSSNGTAGTLGDLFPLDTVEIRVGPTSGGEPTAFAKRIFGTRATHVCQNDIAVIVLDRDVVAPLMPLRFDTVTTRGETVAVLGYGQTEQPTSSGRHIRRGVRVVDVGEFGSNPGSSTAAPKTVVISQGACHGDSGGPAISETTGAQIGVYSLLMSASCTAPSVRNVYTQVAPFETLIREALEYAGHEPIVEGEEPIGTGGAGGEPGFGGAPTEGGAPSIGEGGATDPGSGGSLATGGTGTQTSGESGSAGTSDEPGEGSGATGAVPGGSGSRRDPSCACRTAPFGESTPFSAGLSALFLFGALARRFRTRRE